MLLTADEGAERGEMPELGSVYATVLKMSGSEGQVDGG